MSHFTVLVIGNNPEKQLQPFHEYECTGIEDEYVVDVDKTEEVAKWLDEELFVGQDKETAELDYHYHEDKAAECLVSCEKVTRKRFFEIKGLNQDAEIADYHGYEKRGDKWIRHTNPNSKWDYYSLGGRWTGYFKMKQESGLYNVGNPGLMTTPADVGYADQAYKKDIDFDFKRNRAAKEAEIQYDKAMDLIGSLPINESWEAVKERIKDVDAARSEYWAQPRCVAWYNHDSVRKEFGYDTSPDDFLIPKDQYILNARNSAGVPFAAVKDGKWYEKGQMGWFAMVSNEKDQNEWNEQFWQMIEELPDDTLLSLYDCHI